MATLRLFPPRDVFSEFSRLTREMDRLMTGMPNSSAHDWAGVYPPVNLSEDGDGYHLAAELPGVTADQLDISVVGQTLTLKGERTIAEKEGAGYHRRERTAGSFSRVLELPSPVDKDKIKASLKNGILSITLPKAEEAKPRRIEIN